MVSGGADSSGTRGLGAQTVGYRYGNLEALAQRVLVAEAAQHLADLVNALPPDTRGSHGCRADDGRSWRLVFRTTGGTEDS